MCECGQPCAQGQMSSLSVGALCTLFETGSLTMVYIKLIELRVSGGYLAVTHLIIVALRLQTHTTTDLMFRETKLHSSQSISKYFIP